MTEERRTDPAAQPGQQQAGSSGGTAATRRREPYDPEDRPGDPACLLRRVCPACGSVADEDPPTTCPTCHATIP
jgi:rubrerythrin